MARRRRPESEALAYLAAIGGPTVEGVAGYTDLSPAQVSRGFSGHRPLNPAVLAVIRVLCGPAAADEVERLAELARRQVLEEPGD